MSKRFGIALCAALVGVMALPAGTAQAGFTLTVTIEDLTVGSHSTMTYDVGSSSNASPNGNEILIADFNSGNSSNQLLDLTALDAKFTDSSSANAASLNLSGAAAAYGTDTYQVTVSAVRTGFQNPTLPDSSHVAVLTQSQSGTFTATTGDGDSQNFQSYLDLGNNGNTSGAGVYSPGQQAIMLPAIASTTSSLSSPPAKSTILPSMYSTPYSLTTSFSLRITGNGSNLPNFTTGDTGNPATAQFQASSTVTSEFHSTAVPEPASVVLMLTGMPLPLVVLGMLRRRRAAA
jgi:hypothetical protein